MYLFVLGLNLIQHWSCIPCDTWQNAQMLWWRLCRPLRLAPWMWDTLHVVSDKVPPWYACRWTYSLVRLLSKERWNGPSFGLNFFFSLAASADNSVDYNNVMWHIGAGLMGERGAESIHAHVMKLERVHQGIPNPVDRLKLEQVLESAPCLISLPPPSTKETQHNSLRGELA